MASSEALEMGENNFGEVSVSTKRKAQNVTSFRAEYNCVQATRQGTRQYVESTLIRRCDPTRNCTTGNVWDLANRRIPVLRWLRRYNFRQNIINDLIAGITVGIMHIPHGMAYGILAGVSAVNGLYVSFFPVLVYFLLGTSRHVSIGSFAVISIMVGKTVEDVLLRRPEIASNLTGVHPGNISEGPGTYDDEQLRIQAAVQVAMVVCFVVGLIQAAFGVLRMGIFSVILTDIVVSGFTTGTAVHIFTGQVKHILGIQIPSRSGLFKVAYTWVDIFSAIHQSNYIAVSVSAAAILCLELVSRFVNPKFQARFKFLLPIELITIILGTAVCHLGKLETDYNLKVVGTIPTGIPAPRLINWDLIPEVFVASVPIAVVSFTTLLSLGKLLAKKGGYKVNANQDLFAIGVANIASSFFSCYPCSVSLSRSLLQFSTGGKSQIASLVSCIFIMTILLSIGPLFRELPFCILASVIAVTISKMFRQANDARNAWTVCKIDAVVWVTTFVSVVLFDVDIGLGIGLLATILSVVCHTCKPKSATVGLICGTELYGDVAKYSRVNEERGVKVFRCYAAPYFANKDHFRKMLFRQVGLNPVEILAKQKKSKDSGSPKMELVGEKELKEGDLGQADCLNVHAVVIDCSNWNFIDSAGINVVLQVVEEFEAVNVAVLLAGCLDPVLETLWKHASYEKVLGNCIFPSLNDAMAYVADNKGTSENATPNPVPTG